MQELLNELFPNVMSRLPDFYAAIKDTLIMVAWSGAVSFVLGLMLGVLLTVTKPGGICGNKAVYHIADKLISLFRSIPFIILLTWVMPISRAIMGTAIYVRGAIVPLVFGCVPFFARQVQSALAELDEGLVEAALSMGSSRVGIIFRVYLKESIQNIGNTFIIPLNLYSQKVSSVSELKDGDTVAIPDDPTNGGRALKVLEAAGLIELDPAAAFNPTTADITAYKTGLKIVELKANVIPSALADVSAAVVNGNYALDFGLKTEEAIYKDTVLDEEEYWCLVAARNADMENAEKAQLYKKVVAAFQSPETEKVFNEKFGGYFISVGWVGDTGSAEK